MRGKAVIIGGTGQIGRQVVRAFHETGWQVTAVQRGKTAGLLPYPDVPIITADREAPGVLERAVGSGADVLIDTVAVKAEHAEQLVGLQSRVGRFVVISSASVYCDDKGRTVAEHGFADLPIPVPETHRTITPGPHGYSARKAAVEDILLQKMVSPLTIVRPAAVYGPGSQQPREWWFLKRLLDGRKVVPLAFDGKSHLHTSATANLAGIIRVAVGQPGTTILNAADPAALSSREIGEAIARATGHDVQIACLAGPPVNGVGASPWSLPHPLILDMSAAEAIGYRPVTTYADFVKHACAWLIDKTRHGAWQDALPSLGPEASAWFNYAAEDVVLSKHSLNTTIR